MRTLLWSAAALLALAATACGDDGNGMAPPTPSPFGLDTRPSNTTCLAKPRPVLDTGVKLERQWPNITFDTPMYMVQAPGDDTRWYVAQRGSGGTVRNAIAKLRVVPTAATTNADVTDFATVTVDNDGEGGMLSFAFHPKWPTTNEVYLSYTREKKAGDPAIVCAANADATMTSVVARYHGTMTALDPTADEILKVGQPYTNHKGGTINFNPNDGYLYLGLGDGGDGNDTCRSGQNKNTLLGKTLRIDVNNTPAGKYNVPTDNPYVGDAAFRPEIWSWGHRNPFRWSFDRDNGDMWVGDVGQGTWEEIDHVTKGGNYGWNTCEGFHLRGDLTRLCNTPGLIDPIVEHNRTDAQAIIGGYVYHGSAMPSLDGTYIYGDNVTGNVWALTYDTANKPVPKLLLSTPLPGGLLSGFAQGHDGEIYVILLNGQISKLVPAAAQQPDMFPKHLSETGCVDASDATKPAAGLIPYTVNSPLWSDGADKGRWLALPDGQTITVTADNDFDLPIGSVAMKSFAVDDKLVETRLFMRHDDGGWAGYTYEWDADGKDATLLTGGKTKSLSATRTWTYPSRTQCIQCHSAAAGGTIGLEIAQLNGNEVYPSTNRQSNQLATLDHIGLFAAPLADPATLPALAVPTGSDAIDTRARSYLHANCSHCHRPDGGGQGTMDLRYATSFAGTKTCNAMVTQGPVGTANQIITPGTAATSVMSLRIHATDASRMPPVAVSVLDPDGSKLIDDWITSLTACP